MIDTSQIQLNKKMQTTESFLRSADKKARDEGLARIQPRVDEIIKKKLRPPYRIYDLHDGPCQERIDICKIAFGKHLSDVDKTFVFECSYYDMNNTVLINKLKD